MKKIKTLFRASWRYLLFDANALVILICLYLLLFFFFFWGPYDWNDFKKEGFLTFLLAIPPLVLVAFRMSAMIDQERSRFLNSYISKLFTERELLETFHHLVAEYEEDDWRNVQKIIGENIEKSKNNFIPEIKDDDNCKSMWLLLSTYNLRRGRQEGNRFYHPKYFQGSEEEIKLDALLGYFDLIGYYYHERIIKIEDVVFTLGYYLRGLLRNGAVQEYLNLTGIAALHKKGYKKKLWSF